MTGLQKFPVRKRGRPVKVGWEGVKESEETWSKISRRRKFALKWPQEIKVTCPHRPGVEERIQSVRTWGDDAPWLRFDFPFACPEVIGFKIWLVKRLSGHS